MRKAIANLVQGGMIVGGLFVGFLLTPAASSADSCNHQACNLDSHKCEAVRWEINCSGDPCDDSECVVLPGE